MTATTTQMTWESKKTQESEAVVEALTPGFERVDAYRYNSASIRVRVIDSRFEGLPVEQRDSMVDPYLAKLPEHIQADVMNLLTFAPSEIAVPSSNVKEFMKLHLHECFMNMEFDNPSPSML